MRLKRRRLRPGFVPTEVARSRGLRLFSPLSGEKAVPENAANRHFRRGIEWLRDIPLRWEGGRTLFEMDRIDASAASPTALGSLEVIGETLGTFVADLVHREIEERIPYAPLVTGQKLAELIGAKTVRTIKTLRAKGLPGYKLEGSREVFYDVEESCRWIREHAV
jgi:hypothetical protein